jgi:hypothetical protein
MTITDKDCYTKIRDLNPTLLTEIIDFVDKGATADAISDLYRTAGKGERYIEIVGGAIRHYIVIKINAHSFGTTVEFVRFWDELNDTQQERARAMFRGLFEPEQYAWQVGLEGNILARRKLSGSGQILKHLRDPRY